MKVNEGALEMTTGLDGRHVLVTAAGQGIGKAIVRRLIADGAVVYATDKTFTKTVQDENGALNIGLDVTDRDAIDALAAEIGPLDALINCAGFVPGGTVLDCRIEEWNFAIDLNVTSILHTVQAFLPGMVARKRGAIVNISSIAGAIKAVADRCAYSVTKAAVSALTKSIALDFVGDGIRANAVCPGTIDTPSLRQRLAATGDADAAYGVFCARQPMNRLGTADEVADIAAFLASDRSSFVTGQNYVVDGGWTM